MRTQIYKCDICGITTEPTSWDTNSHPIQIWPFNVDGINGHFGKNEDHCPHCRGAIVKAVLDCVGCLKRENKRGG